MQDLIPYIPAGVFILLIVGLKAELSKRPTWTEARKEFKENKVCDEIHKSIDEKLKPIPTIRDSVVEIKTKIDLFLKKNGK